jgi:hypothetical protein
MADRMVAVLGKSPAGVRAEVPRAKLAASRSQLGRPMVMLLASGRVKKTGERRSTVYYLGGTAARPAPSAVQPARARRGTRPSAGTAAKTARKRRAKADR